VLLAAGCCLVAGGAGGHFVLHFALTLNQQKQTKNNKPAS
jgi:hypothetical protein